MTKTKVLIAVKTYPSLSEKYNELVCTAGFKGDGTWVRIYPIPFRFLNYKERYKKWDYIDIDIVKNTKDFRIESFRPTDLQSDIKISGSLTSDKNWIERKKIVLKNVTSDLALLIKKAKTKYISLAMFKPKKVIDFIYEPTAREWDKKKLDKVKANLSIPNLFEEKTAVTEMFRIARKLPYKFSYIFTSSDDKEHKLMIEDWELGVLYWKYIDNGESEVYACKKVREKFFDWMYNKRDLYFMLGTTAANAMAKNPFIIIGTFYPPKDNQLYLNFEEE